MALLFFFATVENTEKHREKNQGQLGKLACQRQDESPWETGMRFLVCSYSSFHPDVLTPSLVF